MAATAKLRALACALIIALAAPACAQPVRIGLITTLSGPQGLLGQDILDGFRLALNERGGQLGGAEIALLTGDDQLKPEIARQLAEQMIERDHADIITGTLNSSVLLAIARPVLDAGRILISANAGPSQLAGAQCNANFFAIAGQNDVSPEAMGQYLTSIGVRRVFLLAPNYQAGKDKMAGFRRRFGGQIVGEIDTPFDQLDYAGPIAEIRRANPDALFEFLPGATGIAFLKQWRQSGLDGKVKLYADRGGLDETMLAAVGDAAEGAAAASSWSGSLDNPQNRHFMQAFRAAHHRAPSLYAAQGYDTALLLDAAIRANGSKFANSTSFRAALLHAPAPTLRGTNIRFARNHFPIDDYYLMTVTRDVDGQYSLATGKRIVANLVDSYVDQCHLPAD